MLPYASYLEFPGWNAAPGYMKSVIDRERARSILEVGGGRTPTLDVDEVGALGLDYTVNDIEAGELELLDPAYATLAFDMSAPLSAEISERRFDLIFSRMVNEHVADGEAYYRHIYGLLKPGALTVHFFATFFTLPSLLNRFAPDPVTVRLQAFSFRRSEYHYEKFPARYHWCRGPSAKMKRRFEAIGFEVEQYRGYFGHGYYSRVAPLHRLEQAKTRWLVEHPVPALTSYAVVELRRPPGPG
jgi:hypothetical protein